VSSYIISTKAFSEVQSGGGGPKDFKSGGGGPINFGLIGTDEGGGGPHKVLLSSIALSLSSFSMVGDGGIDGGPRLIDETDDFSKLAWISNNTGGANMLAETNIVGEKTRYKFFDHEERIHPASLRYSRVLNGSTFTNAPSEDLYEIDVVLKNGKALQESEQIAILDELYLKLIGVDGGGGQPLHFKFVLPSLKYSLLLQNVISAKYRIKRNSGSGKKAIVAVGRKLINRIHSLVINNQCYNIGENC
jgi:hypothetical protein